MQRAQFMNDRGVPHSTILLAPNILPENALLNKSVKEIERIALEEAEKISPRYTRGKEIKRKGYASTSSSKNSTS
jgi:transposase-like protein